MSMLEAMVCGAFPIQTNTSCADEWIVDGKSGFIVDPDNLMNLVSSIKTALIDDSLVDGAAEINYLEARKKLDRSIITTISQNFYASAIRK